MAELSGNDYYVAIDGVDVSGYATEIKLTPGQKSEEVTAGAGATHEMLNEAINNTKISITISYRVGEIANYIQRLKPGIHTVEYGIEKQRSGTPRHKQEFHFETGGDMSQSVKKTHVTFSVSGNGSAAPEWDIMSGAIWP